MKFETNEEKKTILMEQDQYTYVLKLQGGKWYVGLTSNPYRRLMQHFNESGSAWTQMYPPLQIHEVTPAETVHDEDNLTFEYMMEYGVENVRGGIYVQTVLPDEQVREIERRRRMVNGLCVICGDAGHVASDCAGDRAPAKKKSSPPVSKQRREREPAPSCMRCGRDNHESSSCFARSHVNGSPLKSRKRKPEASSNSIGEFTCPGCNKVRCNCGLNC
jgi:predicted GIY-YIG superfamily endonuclease